MTFIGILLALLAERILGHLPRVGEPLLTQQLIVKVQRYVPLGAYWRAWVAPVLLLMGGSALVAVIDWQLRQPLLDLAFATVVLFLCLGPRHLASDIQALISAHERNDEQAERTLTLALLRGPGRRATRRSLIGALFIQSHERVFGVLLWFFAAGPAGVPGCVSWRKRGMRPRRGCPRASPRRCSAWRAASTRRSAGGASCAPRTFRTGGTAHGRRWRRPRRRRWRWRRAKPARWCRPRSKAASTKSWPCSSARC
jgi:hypothetical protein